MNRDAEHAERLAAHTIRIQEEERRIKKMVSTKKFKARPMSRKAWREAARERATQKLLALIDRIDAMARNPGFSMS